MNFLEIPYKQPTHMKCLIYKIYKMPAFIYGWYMRCQLSEKGIHIKTKTPKMIFRVNECERWSWCAWFRVSYVSIAESH